MNPGTDYTGISIVFYCHDGKGNVLLAFRSEKARDEHGVWDIGGGKLELHDTVEHRLRTEIQEEYCAEVREYEFLGYRDVHRGAGQQKTHWIALDFKVRIDPEQVKNGEPEKFDEVRFFPKDRFPVNMHSQWSIFLDKYHELL